MEKILGNADLSFEEIRADDIEKMVFFLNNVFKTKKFTNAYLNQIYFKNNSAIGYNVFEDDNIVAHYCVLLKNYNHLGANYEIGWSVNTAVDRNFRGRGFFLDLANRTYELARQRGIVAIVGVANRNSTRLFLEKLKFEDRGMIRWNVDLAVRYHSRRVEPSSFSHLSYHVLKFNGGMFLRRLPFLKIYSKRDISFFSVYLTNRTRLSGLGFTLPQNWFKSNWQVITLNLLPDNPFVEKFLDDFAIDIGESDTF